jgi:hypothetical protein
MIIFKFNNINFEVIENPRTGNEFNSYEQNLGACLYFYQPMILKQFFEDTDNETCTQNEEETLDKSDFFITFVDWAGYLKYQEATIKIQAQHPYWVFHDLCHAESKDIIGCEGNVDAQTEKSRLAEGVALMHELSEYRMTDFLLMNMINDSFYQRFNEPLELDCFCPEYQTIKQF